MPGIHLEPFDPSRELQAQTDFLAGGVSWKRGQPFDKSAVNDRVLRQLYDARKVGYPGVNQIRAVPPRPPKAMRAQLDHDGDGKAGGVKDRSPVSDEEKAKLLVDAHTHAQLFAKAKGIEGVKKSDSKTEIALALVKAGNEPA